jgi:hypothetical protein
MGFIPQLYIGSSVRGPLIKMSLSGVADKQGIPTASWRYTAPTLGLVSL